MEYLKPKEIHQIMSNPGQKYALILDEVNRAEPEMAPILFQLFEKKIENKTYDNLLVIAMINLGQEYDTNIDFTSDKALLRRVSMMEFKPNTEDILKYARDKGYNNTIQKVMEKLDGNYWSYSSKSQSEKEVENVTTLGSFYDWNNYLQRLSQLENKDHNAFTITEMITTWVNDVSHLYFNSEIGGKIYSILVTLKNLLELDIQKDVIDKEQIPDDYKKDGMKFIMEDYTGNRYKIEWNENTPTILEHTDKKTLNEQMSKIYSLFNTNKEVKQSTSKQSTINNENTLNEMINKTRKM